MTRPRRRPPDGSIADQVSRLLLQMRATVTAVREDDGHPLERAAVLDTVTQWADLLEAVQAKLVSASPEQP